MLPRRLPTDPTSGEAMPLPDVAATPLPGADGFLLVQFAAGIEPEHILARAGITQAEVIRPADPVDAAEPAGTLLRVAAPEGVPPGELLAVLSAEPGVSFAEPDFTVTAQLASNDPRYLDGSLWGMLGDQTTVKNAFGSQAGEAWAAGKVGNMKTVVGVVDTGIDYTHVDLYLNIWLNRAEIPRAFRDLLVDSDRDGVLSFRDLNSSANAAWVRDVNANGRIDAGDLLNDSRWENGIDDDGNGLRDDLIGWDYANNDNDPFDDNGHGTHVAGTIGATGGNGTGVAGVAWNVQMVALKFLNASGSGAISGAIQSVDYFTNASKLAAPGQNFVATNNSWGGGSYSSALQDAVTRAAKADILFVAAAGNSAQNNDAVANWPSNLSTTGTAGYEAVISVAALTSTGGLASFSNFGATTVDIAAPGQAILSTMAGGGYASLSGTSMAAPHVTGAIALYAAENAAATAAQIRAALLGTAEATPSLVGRDATGGRLDIGDMMGVAPGSGTAAKTATILSGFDDVGSVQGRFLAGATTDDTRPLLNGSLSGALSAGETLVVYRDGVKAGNATVTTGSAGVTWSWTESMTLTEGGHSYTARVESVAGNGAFSGAFAFTVAIPPSQVVGTTRSETVIGTDGRNIVSGVPLSGSHLGAGTVDLLYGRGGNDTFLLGDARGVFYNDGNALRSGTADYAQIMDFATGDKIQLAKAGGAYFLLVQTVAGRAGVSIYCDTNRSMTFDGTDELIGHIAGGVRLASTDFVFV